MSSAAPFAGEFIVWRRRLIRVSAWEAFAAFASEGDADEVAARLAAADERFGYRVLPRAERPNGSPPICGKVCKGGSHRSLAKSNNPRGTTGTELPRVRTVSIRGL